MTQGSPDRDDEKEELVATERAAYITYLLLRGATLTTAEIAAELGMTHSGAWQLMQKVARRVPLRQDLGYWIALDFGN